MILATTRRRKYLGRFHGSCYCSHLIESITEQLWHQGGRALIQNTECRIPDRALIPDRKAERRVGERTDPSSADGGFYSRHYADLRPSGIDVSEKYLAFDGKPCYSDSQPETPLFKVTCDEFTINQKGDLGYFFNPLTGHY